jgi:hypothetical protein
MRTASFEIDKDLFFENIGMDRSLLVNVVRVDVKEDNLVFYVEGYSDALPDRTDYPRCNIICKTISSHFEEVKK